VAGGGGDGQAGGVVDDLFDVGEDGSVLLRLHVVPGAGRTAVVGRHGDAVKIRVAAPPERGRANDASLALVATTFGVPAGQVELVSGPSSRTKRVRVSGVEPDDVRRLLESALAGAGEVRPAGGRAAGNTRPGRSVR
jgi:uncharacterized protein (TIGR00251 family)